MSLRKPKYLILQISYIKHIQIFNDFSWISFKKIKQNSLDFQKFQIYNLFKWQYSLICILIFTRKTKGISNIDVRNKQLCCSSYAESLILKVYKIELCQCDSKLSKSAILEIEYQICPIPQSISECSNFFGRKSQESEKMILMDKLYFTDLIN